VQSYVFAARQAAARLARVLGRNDDPELAKQFAIPKEEFEEPTEQPAPVVQSPPPKREPRPWVPAP
jgi:hypothetical protein